MLTSNKQTTTGWQTERRGEAERGSGVFVEVRSGHVPYGMYIRYIHTLEGVASLITLADQGSESRQGAAPLLFTAAQRGSAAVLYLGGRNVLSLLHRDQEGGKWTLAYEVP